MTKEVQRVLKTGGYYFVISYGKPENRTLHFERPHLDFIWELGTVHPANCKTPTEIANKKHYTYWCQKGEHAQENYENNWKQVEAELIKASKDKEEQDSSEEEEIVDKGSEFTETVIAYANKEFADN